MATELRTNTITRPTCKLTLTIVYRTDETQMAPMWHVTGDLGDGSFETYISHDYSHNVYDAILFNHPKATVAIARQLTAREEQSIGEVLVISGTELGAEADVIKWRDELTVTYIVNDTERIEAVPAWRLAALTGRTSNGMPFINLAELTGLSLDNGQPWGSLFQALDLDPRATVRIVRIKR
ncbi:Hypothetical protein AJAP_42750 (plasmid) [Amycolatopsis japonica]|uniref:Uncharacterized protein n=1 Tax=Amycolatopsis japonica TaxID=208439 RepID=A0A075V4L9_9PSEU|nr:hypothetical protein [Amycolatopsis japonica]AIG81317.1 Hypothetical protein AJAP_42750 [Amycolatopsis japonica]